MVIEINISIKPRFSRWFCMSHWNWVYTDNGICPECGSAMLEKEDMR